MYGSEIIKTYFSSHPDKEFDALFSENAGFFCGCRNSIYKFERIANDTLIIYFLDKTELSNVPIIIDGYVGHYRLAQPHTTMIRSGAFVCQGVTRLKQKEPTTAWRWKDIKVKKKFWHRGLSVQIVNENMNIRFRCEAIYPLEYSSSSYSHPYESDTLI
ncbi:hypothetical protein [Pontibacter sp. BAB1700]|uniref:hypothetical protein n=1 Tax=Pontibacter sp. BAB1700 TaxID=1144253 RepID=UPI00026BE94F|nr:hypothetical protein [Pontibacter sp. BAB1700]EJF09329.1 hypothetical protein O71_15760 [Pontibacter sp. BAB1700]